HAQGNAEKQPAAGLRIREQNFLSFSDSFPLGKLVGKIQVVTAASWHTFLLDERENLRAERRHTCSKDFCSLPAGPAHRTEVAEKPKAGHIDSGTDQPALGQFGPRQVEL